MIRDKYMRLLFIPLLGIVIPIVSGIITYSLYSPLELLAANIYFIFTSYCIWKGSNWIHSKLRRHSTIGANPFRKIASFCGISFLYGCGFGTISTIGWFYMSADSFTWRDLFRFNLVCGLAIIVFTLVYEVLFLNKERELDNKIVKQLDRERSQAELEALRNELDPHFIFNSLNTLNHLILNNSQQAYLFNNKLAQVYKYFLVNKHNELISLWDELEFIDSYFFLLKIRHDDKLNLQTRLDDTDGRLIMIPPLALQILMENAIKHNEFNDDNPLHIQIAMNHSYLKVSNNVKPKPYLVNSTGIGLKNLSARYRILCNKDIVIENSEKEFTVKLPLICQEESLKS